METIQNVIQLKLYVRKVLIFIKKDLKKIIKNNIENSIIDHCTNLYFLI